MEKQSSNTRISSKNTSKLEKKFDATKIPNKSTSEPLPKLDFSYANKRTNWYLLSTKMGEMSDFDCRIKNFLRIKKSRSKYLTNQLLYKGKTGIYKIYNIFSMARNSRTN